MGIREEKPENAFIMNLYNYTLIIYVLVFSRRNHTLHLIPTTDEKLKGNTNLFMIQGDGSSGKTSLSFLRNSSEE